MEHFRILIHIPNNYFQSLKIMGKMLSAKNEPNNMTSKRTSSMLTVKLRVAHLRSSTGPNTKMTQKGNPYRVALREEATNLRGKRYSYNIVNPLGASIGKIDDKKKSVRYCKGHALRAFWGCSANRCPSFDARSRRAQKQYDPTGIGGRSRCS